MVPDFETALMDLIREYVDAEEMTLDEVETVLVLRLYALRDEIKSADDAV